MEVLTLIGFTLLMVTLAFILFGVKVFFHKSKKFPETSAGHNKDMRKLGIKCPRHEEIKCWTKRPDAPDCATCYEHSRN